MKLTIKSNKSKEMIDITAKINQAVSHIKNGYVLVFVPHTTAAITINENADPDVTTDMLFALKKISPIYKEFKHFEGNSDAHVLSSLIGCQINLIIANGKLLLGRWQSVYFCELDGPRTREVTLQVFEC